jgi:hypothetical protein
LINFWFLEGKNLRFFAESLPETLKKTAFCVPDRIFENGVDKKI